MAETEGMGHREHKVIIIEGTAFERFYLPKVKTFSKQNFKTIPANTN